MIAKADLRKPLVPAVVEVRYRTEGGARLRGTMSREGTVDPARDRYQEYAYTFRGVLTPIGFDVVGGDDAVRDLRIEFLTKLFFFQRFALKGGNGLIKDQVQSLEEKKTGLNKRLEKEKDPFNRLVLGIKVRTVETWLQWLHHEANPLFKKEKTHD